VRCKHLLTTTILLCGMGSLVSWGPLCAQQAQVLGSIVGHVSVGRSGPPRERVLVSLIFRGAAIDSVYTDSQGTFGFHNLGPNPYTVSIEDDQYQPLQEQAVIEANTLAPMVFLNVILVPKATNPQLTTKNQPRPTGANPAMADVRELSAKFPKRVLKEFHRGVDADQIGNKDEAVRHYAKAVEISPDFYPAHNNLGSDHLSRSEFANARKEFEKVILLNKSDAAAYFNLGNVCMMMGQPTDAQIYLDEGMRREPDSALGHFLLGSLAMKTGKFQQAEELLRHTIQLSPTMAQAHLQLVNLMLQQNRNAEATSELHLFVTTFPDSPFVPKAHQLLQKLETSSVSTSK